MDYRPQDAHDICKRAEQLFESTERTNARSIWELIATYILPNQSMSFFGSWSPGDKRTQDLYDSTAPQANHDLAAAIHATLTNPATKWAMFKFRHPFDDDIDKQLQEDIEIKEFREKSERKFHEAINSSNFNTEIAKAYQSFTSMGNGILMHEEQDLTDGGKFRGFMFRAWHLAEVAWSENALGMVDEVYRKFKWAAKKVYSRWGDASGPMVLSSLKDNPDKEITLIHCIYAREDDEIKLDASGRAPAHRRPYASVYVIEDDKTIIEHGGYYEMPAHVFRYELLPDEVYGRGPGTIALPDVRTLNQAKKLGLRAIAKAIDPPYLTTAKNVISASDMRPGRPTVVRRLDEVREWVTNTRFDVTQFAVEELRKSIRSIFFLDKLFLPDRTDTGEMTAFEIARRTEELQRVLGPTLGRLHAELLDPIVKRSFNMMLRGGAFGKVPDLLKNAYFEVEYVNALSRSQKIEDVKSIQSWAQVGAIFAQLGIPNALDNVDSDGAMLIAAEVLGVPQRAIRTEKEKKKIRDDRAKAQQAAAALEAGVKAADIQSKMQQSKQQGQ